MNHFDSLPDEDCIEYAANCIAEGIDLPEAIANRLKKLGVYDLIMESSKNLGG
jgi:hypothetical protein